MRHGHRTCRCLLAFHANYVGCSCEVVIMPLLPRSRAPRSVSAGASASLPQSQPLLRTFRILPRPESRAEFGGQAQISCRRLPLSGKAEKTRVICTVHGGTKVKLMSLWHDPRNAACPSEVSFE